MSSKLTKPKEMVVEECERQFEFIQALKRTDFFKREIGDKDTETASNHRERRDNGGDEDEDEEVYDEFDSSFVDEAGDYENESAPSLSKESTSNDLRDRASQRRRGSGSTSSVGRRSSGKYYSLQSN